MLLLWPYNQHWESGCAQNMLGHAAQHPAFQAATVMSCQYNQVTATEYMCALCIFTGFCRPDEGIGHIFSGRYGPGEGEIGIF